MPGGSTQGNTVYLLTIISFVIVIHIDMIALGEPDNAEDCSKDTEHDHGDSWKMWVAMLRTMDPTIE